MTSSGYLALCDRAFQALGRLGPLTEEHLLAQVYGGAPPPALRAKLAAPLLDDPRLERRADGSWARRAPPDAGGEITLLALATTGPSPQRGRIVHVSMLHLAGEAVLARFNATVHPGTRVPAYVAARLGFDAALLNDAPALETIFDGLVGFLGARPVCAQDALLTWSFVEAEARRHGKLLGPQLLVDVNELARGLSEHKPSLARVAQDFGIAFGQIEHPDEEARVLALAVPKLLRRHALGPDRLAVLADQQLLEAPLRRGTTARALPDQPGVYVLRDRAQQAVYVGKARRLRSRLEAYVHRPLGPTRRLEGLVGSVDAVGSEVCETDLEALVLEDREIQRLQPRFNTVRRQRMPRLWLRLPPVPVGRRRAPRRLELAVEPQRDDGEYLGPFRNEAMAEQARHLAREVFELDAARRGDRASYEARLRQAWAFLHGEVDAALATVQQRRGEALARTDADGLRECDRLLARARSFDSRGLLLPADPRAARYVVLRPSPHGVEGFLVHDAVLVQYAVSDGQDATRFASELLTPGRPRTTEADVAVTVRWLGAQRPSTRLLLVTDEQRARDAIEDAVFQLSEERSLSEVSEPSSRAAEA